ncbi:MAG: T9SS type A sorting domain-containing protein [Chitinophagales bacterium]|nr:T9SS type A sorting domain-containing protein [Chitinophagales bacterium]
MKKLYFTLFIAILLQSASSFAGFIDGSYKYKGQTRKYSIYVPSIYYTQNKKVPLLLGLHGYGDEISNFKNICLTSIADTANYICVYAEGLPFFGANAWNSGAGVGIINVNSTIDDVGFLNGLVDTVIKKYNIDTNRMYVFGFSFGGFMTDRLATQNSSRFAAVANVSGLHGNFLAGFIPTKGVPYLKFHGTNDPTIKYDGSQTVGLFPGFGLSAEKTVKFWVAQNRCDTIPIIDTMPNTSTDTLTFIRYTYKNGRDRSDVVFYKVINGIHRWYGTPTNDISYCQTIWKFFSQYSKNAVILSTRNNQKIEHFNIYPNPTTSNFTIDLSSLTEKINTIQIYSVTGNLVFIRNIDNENVLNIDTVFPKGMYLVQLINNNGIIATEKIVIQ